MAVRKLHALEKKTPASPDAPTGSSARERILSVYGYMDFRHYLRDFYQFRKDGHRGYSYRSFSRAAGFTSPNVLKLVIDGKRNIGPDALEKFVVALGLKNHMADYFRALVKMNQAKGDEEKQRWFFALESLAPEAKKRELHAESVAYLSHWLYPVIREMVQLPDFSPDPYWIARRLHTDVAVEDIKEAWQFLMGQGFIAALDDGGFAATDSMILSSDEIGSLAIRNYHREMLNQARDALSRQPVSEREFGALTFILPAAALEELKFRLKAFRRELHQWSLQAAEGRESELVVQVNLQMYQHASKKGGHA